MNEFELIYNNAAYWIVRVMNWQLCGWCDEYREVMETTMLEF